MGTFKPVLREDGTLDPVSVERAGLRDITAWLEARLGGHDPCLPLDKRWDEDPEALVVALLKDAGVTHPASSLIADAALRLLESARALAPDLPPYWNSLMGLCQHASLPQTSTWFNEELRALAQNPEAVEARWGGREVVNEILYAAVQQAPGLIQTASQEYWRKLLEIPRYSTMGLIGLASTLQQALPYLPIWWRVAVENETEKQREVDQLVSTAIRTEDEALVLYHLASACREWPTLLQSAIDRALKERGFVLTPSYQPRRTEYAQVYQRPGARPGILTPKSARRLTPHERKARIQWHRRELRKLTTVREQH